MKKTRKTKLNLGSGPNGLDDWLNYDYGLLPLLSKITSLRHLLINLKLLPSTYNLDWPEIKLVNIGQRFPLANRSIKYIYCSHVIEHFHRWQALKILKESHRVLRRNGVIRIVIPDIQKMCKNYLKDLSSKNKNIRPGRNFCWRLWGYEKDIQPQNLIGKISRLFIRDHLWHYDEREISLLFKEAGFLKIKICQFRQGITPDIEKLDLEYYQDHSLYIEAVK